MSDVIVDCHRHKLESHLHADHMAAVKGLSDYITIMNLLFKSISRVLANDCSLTTLQYRILLRLLSAPNHALRTTDFASCLHVNMSTISAALPRLVENNYICRHEDPLDMRAILLELTQKGANAIGKADRIVGEFLKDYWSNLTPEQLKCTLSSSMNAVTLHDVKRIENGKFRLDTAFFDAVMISRTLTEQRLSEIGLKTTEFRIMLALYIHEQGMSISQASDYLFLKSSDVTAPIKSLISLGYLSKARRNENQRVKEICLTTAGLEKTRATCPLAYDALLETCRSDENAVQIHLSAARSIVARERGTALFSQ